MIAVTAETQPIPINQDFHAVTFPSNVLTVGCAVAHQPDGIGFAINMTGKYRISYSLMLDDGLDIPVANSMVATVRIYSCKTGVLDDRGISSPRVPVSRTITVDLCAGDLLNFAISINSINQNFRDIASVTAMGVVFSIKLLC